MYFCRVVQIYREPVYLALPRRRHINM